MAYAAPAGVSIQCKTMRHANEDRFTVIESMPDYSDSVSFFAVYDGHCGDSCSAFLAEALHKYVTGSIAFQNRDFKTALSEGLLAAEKNYRNQFENQVKGDPTATPDNPKPSAGSCAVCVIRTKTQLFIANLGDCRAVAAVNSMSKMLTRDHKASDPIEKARVVEAGGFVRSNRMFGLMSVTRSIGDFEYKLGNITGTLICTPELHQEEISPQHQCLIMACDGLWDVVDNALAVETALDSLRAGKTASETAFALAELAQQRGSKDDITVIVIPLNIS